MEKMTLKYKRKLLLSTIVFFVATVLLVLSFLPPEMWTMLTSVMLAAFGIGNGIEHLASSRRRSELPPASNGMSEHLRPPRRHPNPEDEDDYMDFDEGHH